MTHRFWLGASTFGPGTPAEGIREVAIADDGSVRMGPQIPAGRNPMFLATALGEMLVVAHELEAGQLSLWRTGKLGLQPVGDPAVTGAAGPCHVAVTLDGETAFAADYGGGAVTVHPLTSQGVEAPSLTISYEGHGPNLERQEQSHPHQVVIDQAGDRVFIPDLGLDAIHVHSLSGLRRGSAEFEDFHLPPGAGPRHLVLSEGKLIVANELENTVAVLDADTGEALSVSPSTNSPDPELGASAVRLTQAGYVYVGNRGPNTIGVLHFDGATGTIKLVGEYPVGGEHPRDFELSADERFLIAANQWSDQLAVHSIDPADGGLTLITRVKTPSPACVLRLS